MTRTLATRAGAAVSLLVCLLCATIVLAAPVSATTPPVDPNQRGYLGLCDRSGTQITSGSVDAAPFVWKAVASTTLPPPMYKGARQNAILSIFQLRPDTQSADWSGDQLTAPSLYVNTPATVATTKDESLGAFVQAYPPMLDGLYQLRMFFAANQSSTYTQNYPALYIRVTGHTWTAVGGGTVNCEAAKAQSFEVFDHVVSAKDSGGTDVGTSAKGVPVPQSVGRPASAHSGAPATSANAAGRTAATSAAASTPTKGGGGSTGLVIGVIAAVVVVAGGAAWAWMRRRAPA